MFSLDRSKTKIRLSLRLSLYFEIFPNSFLGAFIVELIFSAQDIWSNDIECWLYLFSFLRVLSRNTYLPPQHIYGVAQTRSWMLPTHLIFILKIKSKFMRFTLMPSAEIFLQKLWCILSCTHIFIVSSWQIGVPRLGFCRKRNYENSDLNYVNVWFQNSSHKMVQVDEVRSKDASSHQFSTVKWNYYLYLFILNQKKYFETNEDCFLSTVLRDNHSIEKPCKCLNVKWEKQSVSHLCCNSQLI